MDFCFFNIHSKTQNVFQIQHLSLIGWHGYHFLQSQFQTIFIHILLDKDKTYFYYQKHLFCPNHRIQYININNF